MTATHTRLVFPLLGGGKENGGVVLRRVYGTAFAIGGGAFMTAGHSLRAAIEKHDAVGVARVQKGPLSDIAPVDEAEIWADLDIGLLRADLEEAEAMSWEFSICPLLFPVATAGFPHGPDRYGQDAFLRTRALGGHIVTATTSRGNEIPGDEGIYELSFQCPKNISGAPLFTHESPENKESRIVGVIVGNGETSIEIGTDTEQSEGDEMMVRRELTTYHGIAVRSDGLQGRISELVGVSLQEHLDRHGLLHSGSVQ